MTSPRNEVPMDLETSDLNPVLLHLPARPDHWALFLDIDGTLLDIAETPDAIRVPADLRYHLHRLSRRMEGALAIVTGRALLYADGLFHPFEFPMAGLHGGELRDTTGELTLGQVPEAFAVLKGNLLAETRKLSGVMVEDKGLAIAVHFRLAPSMAATVEGMMRRYAEMAGPDWALQLGKMVCELRPSRARLMAEPTFRGRLPLAIGDDLTDETMFAAANALGGHSIRVRGASSATCARGGLRSPSLLRAYIALAASAS